MTRRHNQRQAAIRPSSRPVEFLGGVYVWPSDGEATSFVVPHGGVQAPLLVTVDPRSAGSDAPRQVFADREMIMIVYQDPPAPGTIHLYLEWRVALGGGG